MLNLQRLAPAVTLSVATSMSSCSALSTANFDMGTDRPTPQNCPAALKDNLRWSVEGTSQTQNSAANFSLRHSLNTQQELQEIPLSFSDGELRVAGKLNGWSGETEDTKFVIDSGGFYEVILPRRFIGTQFAYLPDVAPIESLSAAKGEKSRLGFISGISISSFNWERMVCRVPESYEGGSKIQIGLQALSACAAVKFDVADSRMVLASKSAKAMIAPGTGEWQTVTWKGFGDWTWTDPQTKGFYNPPMPTLSNSKNIEVPYIDITIDGKPMRAVIDTGCDAGICFFKPQTLSNPHTQTVETVGSDAQVLAGQFTGELKIGQLKVTDLTAYVIDTPTIARPYDCVLGCGFLRNFETVLDFKEQKAHFAPNR